MKKSKAVPDKVCKKKSVNIAVKPLMHPKVQQENTSNCRSKLAMHLNSLFPEQDKDNDL